MLSALCALYSTLLYSLLYTLLSTLYYTGKRDSIHHQLLTTIYETATVLELRQSFYTPPPLGGGGV